MTKSNRKPTIFLCHASEDKKQVVNIYDRLLNEGLDPWLDKNKLLPGQFWQDEIPKAIKTSDFVIVFLSTISVSKRGYVQNEFKLALDVLAEIPEDQIFMLPARLEECQVPERFKKIHYADLFEEGGFEKILQVIKVEIERRELIKQAENSNTEDQEKTDFRKTSVNAMRRSENEKKGENSTERLLKKGFLMLTIFVTGLSITNVPTSIEFLQGIIGINKNYLTEEQVSNLLKNQNFFSSGEDSLTSMWSNPSGIGILNEFELREGGQVIFDRRTQIMWQRSGSMTIMNYFEAEKYIEQLNRDNYLGYSDWRLPVLEEAMTIMEPEKQTNKLHVDQLFDKKQLWIWTKDKLSSRVVWVVDFVFGYCNVTFEINDNYFVRAIRG